MDTFIDKLDQLAALASHEPAPRPLDSASVMARIRGLSVEPPAVVIPFRFLGLGAAIAATVALGVSVLAATAWQDADISSHSYAAIDSLLDLTGMFV